MVIWPVLIPFFIVLFSDAALLFRYIRALRIDSSPQLERCAPISVIVPAYNAKETICDTLQSLMSSKDVRYEILIVDDGSTDDTSNACKPFLSDSIHLISQRHEGKWAALNNGIMNASYKHIAIIDADTKVLPSTLKILSFALNRSDAVAGNLQVANTTSVLGCVQAQEHVRIAMHRRARGGVDTISGVVAGYKKKVLDDVPFLPSCVEDFEHTVRLRNSGAIISYEPTAYAYTKMPESPRAYFSQRSRWANGTIGEMRKHNLPIIGLCKGYFLAICDILALPLLACYGAYHLLLFLIVAEGCIQLVGNMYEGKKNIFCALTFYFQLIVLATIFLVTNMLALMTLHEK